jgi:hypothetical protein
MLALVAWLPVAFDAAHAQDPKASVVAAVARDWLAIVDRADAAAAFARAGQRFRTAMPAAQWAEALQKQRTARGAVIRRTAIGTTFQPRIPNMPPGEFAVLLFRTSFDKDPGASETVTLERESDGNWRVVGYHIR